MPNSIEGTLAAQGLKFAIIASRFNSFITDRLLGGAVSWTDRRHLFNVVATATRQVLVDAARRRLSIKRGGGAVEVSLDGVDVPGDQRDERLLRLDVALARMAALNPRRAQVVEMVYFGGFEQTEIAAAIEVSLGTIERDLRFARAWLKEAVGG